jgi:UDP-glucose 4-epimerase
MENVLITGGAGFIGAHLTREILKHSNFHPVVLDDLSGGFEDNIPEGATFVNGSINDVELIKSLFAEYKFCYVYHLAAYAAEGLSHFIRRFNYSNNLIGSINLINESVNCGVKCFVFTSSIAVYGPGQVPMLESMTPTPEDPYGIAKFAVELDLQNAKHMFGLMNQILQDKPLTIFGDGEQQRAFSYVGDIVGAIASSAWTPAAYGQVFNVGADIPFTVNELAHEVKRLLNKPNHPINYEEARNEVKLAYSDHSKIKSVFPDLPETSLQLGLEKMADWVNDFGARESKAFGNIEIMQNLPPLWLK